MGKGKRFRVKIGAPPDTYKIFSTSAKLAPAKQKRKAQNKTA